jgi:hypothetical protein
VLFVLAAWVLVAVVAVVLLLPLIDHAVGVVLRREAGGPLHSPRLAAITGSLLARRSGPTVLAVLFALVSLPIVALTLDAVDSTAGQFSYGKQIPATDLGRWSAAASAVLISAIIAGTVGAPLVRRRAKIGALVTFHLALLVAIPTLPLLPALLGQHVAAGVLCLDGCSGVTYTNNLLGGLYADLFFMLAPLFEPVPVILLALGVCIWTPIVRRLG